TQFRPPPSPPCSYETLSGCLLMDGEVRSLASVQDGMPSIRSRGKLTTVTRRGASETCTSRFTSFSVPPESLPVQRFPNRCAYFGSQVSTPVSRMSKPPLSAATSGGISFCPSSSTALAL